MTGDAAGTLKEAIRHRIACIDRVTINAFAGTGRSRRRELQATHAIARQHRLARDCTHSRSTGSTATASLLPATTST
jgi:hypothetical protein